MQDDLKERLRAEVVVSEDPPTKLIIDGQEVVCAGSKTTMRRNPDGPEAADRIAALEAKLAEKDALIEHVGGDGVTEGDRDAAKSLLGRDDAGPSWWSIDSGNADNDRLVQAFARHRQAAIKERDAEIVAWLRVREEDYRMSGQGGYAAVLDLAAAAIERGEV